MDSTKKLVLDIERKNEFAKIVMRVLKECKLVKEFVEYTDTISYKEFVMRYRKKNPHCTELWYDRNKCGSILGCCDFERYLEQKYGCEKANKYNTYNLVLAYLAIFNEDEYMRYHLSNDYYYSSFPSAEKYIKNILSYRERLCTKNDVEMVKNWLKLKEIIGHGN